MKLIDAKGQNCPIPVIMAKKEIDAGQNEFLIEVDNPTAVENLQRLADSQGYRTTVESAGGIFRITFVKPSCEVCSEAQAVIAQPAPKTGRWSVFVGKDIIGGGDETLGRSLLKMFFYTLTESEDLPSSILFMNGGVKIPVEDDQIVEHLRVLADRGVKIIVCGTCLNFYQLTDRLQIGTVSNMYDIVEQMKQADKVISL